jgi:hypothetical protein
MVSTLAEGRLYRHSILNSRRFLEYCSGILRTDVSQELRSNSSEATHKSVLGNDRGNFFQSFTPAERPHDLQVANEKRLPFFVTED